MRRNAIDFKTLLRITEEFCEEKGFICCFGHMATENDAQVLLRADRGGFTLLSLSRCPKFFHIALQSFDDPRRVMARILRMVSK